MSTIDPEPETGTIELSVVIVTYNEEDRIESCLDSVFNACDGNGPFEVIVVDSNSTDRTVERASGYPITIYRIPSDDLTTPSAGRYVGFEKSHADRVLFVDGDMVMNAAWLTEAMDELESDGIAAIDGHLNEVRNDITDSESVDYVRGVALYDRRILQEVATFDPFLRSVEDIHLGYQMSAAGYGMVRLPEIAASHPPRNTLYEPYRRWRRGYSIGSGQALRRSIRSPYLFSKHLFRIRHRLLILGWLILGLGVGYGRSRWRRWWGVTTALTMGLVMKKRGFVEGLTYGVHKTVSLVGTLFGLSQTPPDPSSFPIEEIEEVTQGKAKIMGPFNHLDNPLQGNRK